MILLRKLRKEKKMTMKQLGNAIGVAESTISLYETGKRQPDYDTLKKLSDLFQVPIDYLLGNMDDETYAALYELAYEKYRYEHPNKKGVKIPVLGNVAAGIPIEAIEDIVDYEEISEDMASRGEFFGLKIKGSSMEPRIKEGDVVIVRQQPDVESGDVAIVLVNGDSATCKKVVINEGGITLIPFNPTYEPQFYSAEQVESLPVRIIGKVVELRGKF